MAMEARIMLMAFSRVIGGLIDGKLGCDILKHLKKILQPLYVLADIM